jgi:molecular chaperone HtpG
MAVETREFQAEVSRLLEIVAHSLYSEKEVFLRELISNASDACDRHRYLSLTEPDKAGPAGDYKITLTANKDARTLTVADNGIGMSHDELIENLGTIARSGTGKFMEQLSGDAKQDLSLIGQFGVGFYAAFMVASKVEVTSLKAGETQAWKWVSDGLGSFTVEEAEKAERGASILMHLRPDEDEFLEPDRLSAIVRRYSDHIALPIVLAGEEERTLNSASALWTRSKSEITDEQAKEFYHHVSHQFDDPYATIHVRAEGTLEYSALLFVPGDKPFDLFNPERKHGVKLYVRRVFITDEASELAPGYLRFLRGVVDSSDLPLNVSRELLQNNPLIAKIRKGLTKKVLAELEKKSGEDGYLAFWDNFGAVLKEGLYEDFENRETLLKLARFRSTAGDEPVSLEAYVARMKPGQDAIYTISGEKAEALLASPQLEGYRAKGVEVLLLTDPVDEFWMPAVASYEGKSFRSVTRGAADLGKIEGGEEQKKEELPPSGEIAKLIALFKLTLGDEVKDVRESHRLTDSAVCLVADEGDIDMRLEKLLRQHNQLDRVSKRVLELNPGHALIRHLIEQVGTAGASDRLSDAAKLLLDQARILEGETLPDPVAFARRLDSVLVKGLGV